MTFRSIGFAFDGLASQWTTTQTEYIATPLSFDPNQFEHGVIVQSSAWSQHLLSGPLGFYPIQ